MPSAFWRFAAVGGVNTAVYYSTYLGLWRLLPYAIAHVVATGLALCGSYVLNCRFTFGVPPGLRTFALFPLSGAVNAALSTAAVCLLVEFAALDPRIAAALGGLLTTPVTFLVSRGVLTGRLRPAVAEEAPWSRW